MIEQQLCVSNGEVTPFKGEVRASAFITGNALASAIGLTAGVAQHSTQPWLKFLDPVDGLTKYIAKKPHRHSISWDQLNAVNAVRGNKTVVINGKTYKVRLLKGANSNPYVGNSGFDTPGTHGSEWNRLMYHISGRPFVDANNTLASEGITEGDWAQYSEAELVTHNSGGAGNYQWCQEAQGSNRVCRGINGVSYLYLVGGVNAALHYGWRPCLELVN